MKIKYRQPKETADISSARGTAGKELWQLVLSAAVLLVALYFIVGLTVDFVVSRISFETEAKIFKFYNLPAAGEQDASNQEQFEKAVKVLAKLQSDPSVPSLPYRLVLIDHAKPNAFAFPGGAIGVTTNLLDVLDEEIEIAFVLSHELGHFYNRDHLQGMGRAIGLRAIMAMVFSSGSGVASFGNMIEFVLQRGYSQEREKEADRFGVELVFSTYGKVDGIDRLFQILFDEHALPGWAYMFSTHPSPRERINDLKSYADDLRG